MSLSFARHVIGQRIEEGMVVRSSWHTHLREWVSAYTPSLGDAIFLWGRGWERLAWARSSHNWIKNFDEPTGPSPGRHAKIRCRAVDKETHV